MIRYSRGRGIHDNKPEQREAEQFWDFVEALKADRAPYKASAHYFCAPLNGDGTRRREGVKPRRWIALDFDKLTPEQDIDLRMRLTRYQAAAWRTHSSTATAPRERVLIGLERDADREECLRICAAISRDLRDDLGIEIDLSTARGEQPVFGIPVGASVAEFHGDPVDVDALLATLPDDAPVVERAPITAEDGVISGGGRNAELTRRAGRMRRAAMAQDEIESALLAMNAKRCRPPLEEREVLTIARSVARYEAGKDKEAPKGGEGAIKLVDLEELDALAQSVQWLVKGTIASDAVSMIFGAPKTFKSFVALDLALHVAHGMQWCGRKTRQGAVVYVAAEGAKGLARRASAWHKKHGKSIGSAEFRVLAMPVQLLTRGGDLLEAIKAAGIAPALIVVDTMSQTFSGDENTASDVALWIAQLRVDLQQPFGAAVLVVHHSGHSVSERPRGSSAIIGNTDCLIGVFREEKALGCTVTCVNQKDGDPFPDMDFSMQFMELGKDEDGDPIGSLVATSMHSAEEAVEHARRERRAGRGAARGAFLEVAKHGQYETIAREEFKAKMADMEPAALRQAWKRQLDWAVRSGIVDLSEGKFIGIAKNV